MLVEIAPKMSVSGFVGFLKGKIAEYIRTQLHEDQVSEQISMNEYVDPFKG